MTLSCVLVFEFGRNLVGLVETFRLDAFEVGHDGAFRRVDALRHPVELLSEVVDLVGTEVSAVAEDLEGLDKLCVRLTQHLQRFVESLPEVAQRTANGAHVLVLLGLQLRRQRHQPVRSKIREERKSKSYI